MQRRFTLNYWQDDGWYVGKLQEVPGVFSQGETLEELEANIADAYQLVMAEAADDPVPFAMESKEIGVEV
jgi:predicted RNase H-like HicB family nuclease